MIHIRQEGTAIRNGFNISKIKPHFGWTFHLRLHRLVFRLRLRGKHGHYGHIWKFRDRLLFEAVIWPKDALDYKWRSPETR